MLDRVSLEFSVMDRNGFSVLRINGRSIFLGASWNIFYQYGKAVFQRIMY